MRIHFALLSVFFFKALRSFGDYQYLGIPLWFRSGFEDYVSLQLDEKKAPVVLVGYGSFIKNRIVSSFASERVVSCISAREVNGSSIDFAESVVFACEGLAESTVSTLEESSSQLLLCKGVKDISHHLSA